MNTVAPRDTTSGFFVLFVLLVGGYCAWVLTLPLFPSLDGSLHLYYASVLGSLLSGSKTFSSFYFVRHVLPPYALHYYFLIAIAHFFGYVMAGKLLVCLIFVTTAFGFRYLAVQLGPCGDVLSLLAVPLLLTWPLGMGFYNYCLAIGMALWALGMWHRAVSQRSHRLWIGFVMLVILMVLTHPVPTLFIYILIGLDVGWRILMDARQSQLAGENIHYPGHRFRWDIVYMLAAWSTFGYISLFIGAHRVMGNIMQAYPRRIELLRLAKLSTLAMFSGSQLIVVAYRLSLYVLLIFSITLAYNGLKVRWHSRQTKAADLLLVCSILLLIMIPILPPVMNGANYFAQRLMILAWLAALAAASGYSGMKPRLRRTLAIFSVVYALSILALANARIRPVAMQISEIETLPLSQNASTGLILSLPDAPVTGDLNYIPYYWAGARYFRRTRSTLLNGGWLYEYYLPLGSQLNRITGRFTPDIQDSPGDAYQLLMKSKQTRGQIMPHADLVLFTGEAAPRDLLQIVHTLDDAEPSRVWNCHSADWYSLCTAPFAK